jgi:hypothetical protein
MKSRALTIGYVFRVCARGACERVRVIYGH